MSTQDFIEQNVRMLIGDLQLQVILAKAENADLREQLDAVGRDVPEPPPVKTNGKSTRAEAS